MSRADDQKRLQRARAGERRVPKGLAKISKKRRMQIVRMGVEARKRNREARDAAAKEI